MTITNQATFAQRLAEAVAANDSLLCVGLDPVLEHLPGQLGQLPDATGAIVAFNAGVIAATADLVCAYKPNLGFYVAHGEAGIAALEATRRLVPPQIPVILDAKVGDVGSTTEAYATGYFDTWGFDAVTVNPYLGEDALEPFLCRGEKGVLVLCKTSNPGSGDFQDQRIGTNEGEVPFYLRVADRVSSWAGRWPATVGLVVGATYPSELAAVRERCPEQPILLPGVGAQAGDLAGALRAGLDAAGAGLLVSASRSILYHPASDGAAWQDSVREAALALRDAINGARDCRISSV